VPKFVPRLFFFFFFKVAWWFTPIFSGLMKGEDCLCFDSIPFDNLLLANEVDACSNQCNGNTNYFCGGENAISIYVASKSFFSSLLFCCTQCFPIYEGASINDVTKFTVQFLAHFPSEPLYSSMSVSLVRLS
jgi:hypothetical protein